ncbi:MAG: hypothetical protein HW403_244 [Dehalococcoidia bacterium]|nr:hypothetical protein [Dehalococcoidia bacterium]
MCTMIQWGIRKRALLVLAALTSIMLLLAAACSSGVPQSEYDAVKKEAEELKAKVSAQEKESAEQKGKEAPASGVTTLIGAKAVPTPTPAPTATPLPPGATPPAPPARPAYLAERVSFTYHVETLATTRPSKYGMAATVNCLNTNVFKRGQRIVYRFEVFDTSTGKRVTDVEAASVKVKLPHGEEVTNRFSARGGSGPWMWNSTWDIPLDYPLGGLDYEIIVTTKDGRTSTWKQPALVRAATASAAGVDSRLQIFE